MASKRLGCSTDFFVQPLLRALKERAAPTFEIVVDYPTPLALQLRQKSLDGAFLSPIDYAKDYAMYRLFPDVGVASSGESGAAFLHFFEHARSIRTIAVDPRYSSEIVLAHIVLAEKFDTVPTIVPFIGPLDVALQKADAALLVGNDALATHIRPYKLDLVGEWTDITELPFVHTVGVARTNHLSAEELRVIVDSVKSIPEPEEEGEEAPKFRYRLDEDAIAGLSEFFRMAYYHGILPDVPDIKFMDAK